MKNKIIALSAVVIAACSWNVCFGDEATWAKHMIQAQRSAATQNWTESAKALQKAVIEGKKLGELDPRHEESLFELAKCYQTMKLDAKAVELFQSIITLRETRKSLFKPSEESIFLAYSHSLKKQKKNAPELERIQLRLEDARAGRNKSIDPILFAKSAQALHFRYGDEKEHRQITIDQWLARGGVKAKASKAKARLLSPFVVSLIRAIETGDIDTRCLAVCILTRLGPQAAPTYFFLKDWKAKEKS
ncbi:MAG: hypothetical protein P1V97_33035, partial [Planctomycetota bacterium]|nr:hypothetical protein [Planctomycetota bacterium]